MTIVVIHTHFGLLDVRLFPDAAPKTCRQFLANVDEGLYNAGQFYRVVRDDNDTRRPAINVVQGGVDPACPRGSLAHESTGETGLTHLDGTLSAVRWEPGTAGDEFFIVNGDTPELDYGGTRQPDGQGFAAFGRVIRGFEVLRQLASLPTHEAPSPAYMTGQILVPWIPFHVARGVGS